MIANHNNYMEQDSVTGLNFIFGERIYRDINIYISVFCSRYEHIYNVYVYMCARIC